MSWTAVARKDFQDARLSRSLWLLTGLFVLFAAGMAWVYTEIEALGAGDPELTALGLYDFLASSATLFVSIAALVLAYKAVAGERDSGSVKLLLGLPHSRLDVVLGKVVGRTATLAVSIVLGFVVALGVIVALYDAYSLVDYALFVGVTLLFALVYVSLMVGISASVSTSGKAAALAFGTFVVVELLWGAVATAAVYVANGFALPATITQYPTWYFGIVSLSPSAAYQSALATVLDGASTTGEVIGGTAEAVYLEPWFGFVWLALWLVVPLAVGAFRFNRADL
ncbi:ABC transporter permease subunit [Haloarchaeobius iranensis]|uniref:ABC-2 type transport system permease protein n=1 Tax=Haloarchaeobius iranensis TaxID=996166 RepID=A0A1G9VIE5_9EURY|nr:ABC transporter permease subunit [Haloarchaeobius iranensis]SDM71964.1 ABC-2 type transport system permease protein [Haloarchaeobius iranensis]